MKTKVFSLLIALAVLVTVGGVYATWLYAETDMTAVHGHIGSFGVASAEINNSKGTFNVDASGVHLTINQAAPDDYTAVLEATGSIVVKFTPSEIFKNSNPDLEIFKVEYSLVSDNTDPTNYLADDGSGPKPLFTEFDITTKNELELARTTDGAGSVYYTATVSASELLDLISINTFELDTYAKYTAFSAKVGVFGNIGFQVGEPT